jgi:hypothetical protein
MIVPRYCFLLELLNCYDRTLPLKHEVVERMMQRLVRNVAMNYEGVQRVKMVAILLSFWEKHV